MMLSRKFIPGTVLVLGIAAVAMVLNHILSPYIQLEALTIAIILGILANNIMTIPKNYKPGIKFSLKQILTAGIVLLGFKLNLDAVFALGPKILVMVVIYVSLALGFSWLIGRFYKTSNKLAILIGVGSSICGASAVVAMAPCIHADEDDAVVAVSIVSFLGAVGVIVYSAIATSFTAISTIQYGVWSGLSLHGVAHALAAAFARGAAAGEIGTFVKMARVLMLVPVSLVLAVCFSKNEGGAKRVKFPWYVVLFILAGIINGLNILPQALTQVLVKTSSIFILMAMTSMGLSVDFKQVAHKGASALMLGTILFIIMSVSSLFCIIHLL